MVTEKDTIQGRKTKGPGYPLYSSRPYLSDRRAFAAIVLVLVLVVVLDRISNLVFPDLNCSSIW